MNTHINWLWRLDRAQIQVLSYLQNEPNVIADIDTPEKQDQVIRAWAIHQLLNDKKVILVVSDPEQQKRIYELLNAIELASTTFLKNQIAYMPALQLAKKKPGHVQEIKNAQFALSTASQVKSKWDQQYALLYKHVFEGLTWIDLADRLAAHPYNGFPNALHLKLKPSDFVRTADEYKMIRKKLSNFIKLHKLNHPWFEQLSDLNISMLKERSLEQVKTEIQESLHKSTVEGEELIRSGEVLLLDFIQYSKLTLQKELKSNFQKVDHLLFKMRNYEKLLGPEFFLETSLNNIATRLKSNFERTSRDLIKARRWVKSAYLDILSDLNGIRAYLPSDSLEQVELLHMDLIRDHALRLAQQIQDCELSVQNRINENMKRLNSKNMGSDHPLLSRFSEWESQLDNWTMTVNNSQLFMTPREVNALSVEKKISMTASIVRDMREIKRASEKIEDFIFWKSFEDQIPENCQKVIDALEFEKKDRWLDLFDQWYFKSTLDQNALVDPPGVDSVEQFNQLKLNNLKSVAHAIKHKLQAERYDALRQPSAWKKQIHSLLKKKDELGLQLAIQDLAIKDRRSLFPIQIVSPQSFAREFGVEVKESEVEVLFCLSQQNIELGSQLASTTRSTNCHVICDRRSADRMIRTSEVTRKIQFKQVSAQGAKMRPLRPLKQIPSSEKLNSYKELAQMMSPVLDELHIYNTRHVQIFSFLGPKLDAFILDELALQYKLHDQGLDPGEDFVVECLLDRKPIIILYRDGILTPTSPNSMTWQNELIDLFEQVGITMHESWTTDWIDHGREILQEINLLIQGFVPHQKMIS